VRMHSRTQSHSGSNPIPVRRTRLTGKFPSTLFLALRFPGGYNYV